jgi:hypothetical protein
MRYAYTITISTSAIRHRTLLVTEAYEHSWDTKQVIFGRGGVAVLVSTGLMDEADGL